MKQVLKILCILTAIYCVYFPFTYFNKESDKKEVGISHILVETQEDAYAIKNEIENGLNFRAAVKKYSTDESSERYGDIGYHGRCGILDPNFEVAAFKLNRYKVSDPVKTGHGWHLIKVYDIIFFSDRKNFDERYSYKKA